MADEGTSEVLKPRQVLLVDDEESVLRACQRALRKEPFQTVATTSPEEALQWVARETFAAIMSDQRMPAMPGIELLEKVKAVSPDTVRLILTGYTETQAAVDAINKGSVSRFLTKPWNDEELQLALRQAVAQFDLVVENRRLQELTLRQNAELAELNQNLEKKVEERTAEVVLLNQQLEKTFLASIQTLAEAAEIHSTYVGSHSKRVAAIAKAVGKEMNLEKEALFELEVAAILHDVGTLAVPAEVLTRPEASLTPLQREAFRRHSVRGEAIAAMVPNLGNVPKIIRHHHEHCDGSGYPDQLTGAHIPLASKIIAVADAYDRALNTKAVFNTATPQSAVQFVKGLCPSLFDAQVVQHLARCVAEERADWSKDYEVEVRAKDLRAGLILSRDIKTASDTLLMKADTEITDRDIERIENFQETDPIVDGVFVYRKKSVSMARLME